MVDVAAGADASDALPTAEEIAKLFPQIADSISRAAREGKAAPATMQATFWRQAMQP